MPGIVYADRIGELLVVVGLFGLTALAAIGGISYLVARSRQ